MNLQLLPRSVHAHPHAAIEFPALIDGRALRVELDRSVMCRMLQVSDLTPDLVDAFDSAGFCHALGALLGRAGELRGERGSLVGRPSHGWPRELLPDAPVRRIGGEQSNTSVVFGRLLIMKVFRRLVDGVELMAEICAGTISSDHASDSVRDLTGSLCLTGQSS